MAGWPQSHSVSLGRWLRRTWPQAWRIFRARVFRNGARGDRDGTGRRHRGSSLLHGQFDARDRRVFLVIELVERGREPGADVFAVTREAYGEDDDRDEDEDKVGLAIPVTMGMLGLAFVGCALMIAGLPPLSGLIAKFALLTAALNPAGMTQGGGSVPAASWVLLVALILSGLAALIAMTRAGIRAFWAAPDRTMPRVTVTEMAPIAAPHPVRVANDPGRAGHALHAGDRRLAPCVPGLRARGAAARRTTSTQGGWDMRRLLPFPAGCGRAIHPVAAAQSGAYVGPDASWRRGGACRRLGIGGAAATKGSRSAAWRHPPLVITGAGRHRAVQHRRKPNCPRFSRARAHIPGSCRYPLDLGNPYGLAVLACIITSTPGTLWVNFDAAKRILIIHVLDLIDEKASGSVRSRAATNGFCWRFSNEHRLTDMVTRAGPDLPGPRHGGRRAPHSPGAEGAGSGRGPGYALRQRNVAASDVRHRVGSTLFFEAALIIAVLGFVGTVALAKFLLRGEVIE